jgi:hypothetical protein
MFRWRKITGCLSTAALLAGCGAVGDERTTADEPTSSVVEVTTSDGWRALLGFVAGGGADEAESFRSLEEMAGKSDAVVVGSIEGLARVDEVQPGGSAGRDSASVPSTVLRIRVGEGSPDRQQGDLIELSSFGVRLTDADVARSTARALIFLRWREDNHTYRLVSSQGLIVDRGGRAHSVRQDVAADPFDEESMRAFQEGSDFDAVVSSARAARRVAA